MAKDYDGSLGDQNTLQCGKPAESSPQSLGDQSTFGGGDSSSMADLTGLGATDGLDMEIVDLSARYKVERVLGKGGMGEVLLATDTRLERKVAIKRIRGDATRNRTAVSRFLTEAKAIAALNHANAVQIHDYGRDKDGPFLIMEYVDGGSLLDRCRSGVVPVEEAVDFVCQLCDGLARAHEAGIIHRDIKPANVLLTKDGVPKLTDFGLARQENTDHGQTVAGAVLGTIDFMAPEQRRDATQADPRSDLWSLAATLYQMVTGEPPSVVDLEVVPQQLRATLGRALKAKMEERFQTAREFKAALRGSPLSNANPVSVSASISADLEEGICPSCRTQNDLQRKFCKKCAAALRVACLKCNQSIPVWDFVCGECGANQPELLAEKRSEIDAKRSEAERLAEALQFVAAIALANEIAVVTDERLRHQKSWAEAFVAITAAEKQRQVELAAQHFAEARKHLDAFDYQSAIHAMESIPEAMRTSAMRQFLASIRSDHAELQELLGTIAARVQQRDLEGLLEQVDRAAQLHGSREDLRKLRGQLREREAKLIQQRDTFFAEAQRLLAEGNAKGAMAVVEKVRTTNLTAAQAELKTQLQAMVSAETEVMTLLRDAKADGVVEITEMLELFPKVIECLQLNPKHAGMNRLRIELATRLAEGSARCVGFEVTPRQAESLSKLSKQELKKLPLQILGQLPADGLQKLPFGALSKLPAPALTRLPSELLLQLPPIRNSIGMKLKLLPAGRFVMGSDKGEPNETPHEVTLTKPFYLGVHQVTQEQYERVMGHNPSHFIGEKDPVEQISWTDAVEFCRKLSDSFAELDAGRAYRLPTEAEWEYACRAGTTTEFEFGDDDSQLGNYAWFWGNAGSLPHPVGKKQPNAWGLYDMYGNVFEWCQDWYDEGYYKNSLTDDPQGPPLASDRVCRGGSWASDANYCRSAFRSRFTAADRIFCLGFRVVLVPPNK